MFRRPGSIKLFEVFGIRIGVDGSWFLILFLAIFWLSPSFRSALGASDGVAYITTVVTVLLFFGSMILHELGHALVARRQGIEVNRIELFLFGGITQMGRDAQTPGEDFKIAVAGPLATLVFILVCLAVDLAIVGPHRLWDAVLLNTGIHITPVLLALSWLVPTNVLILVFNLVPALPLDGGRIARAAVWRVTGEKSRGTRAAARMGQGFGWLLAGLGIWWIVSAATLAGLWLVAVGWLIGNSARAAIVQSAVSERIEQVTVADIMDTHPVAIPAVTPVGQAIEEYFLRYGWSWFPVVDEQGRLLGIARQERAQAAVDAGEGWVTIGGALEAGAAEGWGVQQDRPLTEVLSSEPLGRLGALMAVDRDGVLCGVVTIEQVRRALQSAFGSAPAR